MERPLYINWLVNEEGVTFEDGVALKCYKLYYGIYTRLYRFRAQTRFFLTGYIVCIEVLHNLEQTQINLQIKFR